MSPSPGNDDPVPIDRSMLAEIAGGDQLRERRMLKIFREANDSDAAAFRRALEQQDIAAITRASHRIKGASELVGAAALAAVCSKLEQAGRAGDWSSIAANRDALFRELERINAYLDTA